MTAAGAGAPGNDVPALEVRGLVKHYRAAGTRALVRAVDDIAFTVGRGETLGVVGESGCGKSTVARLLVRLEQPTAGQVLLHGTDLSALRGRELRAARRRIQLVFQDPYASLNPRLRVGQTLAEVLHVHRATTLRSDHGHRPREQTAPSERTTPDERTTPSKHTTFSGQTAPRDRVAELLSMVGLPPSLADRYPHQLSGGQRQRVGIARALAVEPEVLVLDEPVSALDVSVRAEVINLLARLRAELGLTYVFISHDLGVVRHVSDRIAVMYLGRIVEHGPWQRVSDDPLHPYSHALQQAVPVPDPAVEAARTVVPLAGEVPDATDPPRGCHFHPRCPRAEPTCREVDPPLETLLPGHLAACHVARREVTDRGPVTGTTAPTHPPTPAHIQPLNAIQSGEADPP